MFLNFYHLSKLKPFPFRYKFIIVSGGIIGFGSMLFHGTLQRWAQLLDELPMIYSACSSLYAFIVSNDKYPNQKRGLWVSFFTFLSIGVSYLMIYHPQHSNFFFILFAILCAFLFFGSLYWYRGVEKFTRNWIISYGMFNLGFGLWVIENTFCLNVEFLKFHSLWHLFSALASYRLVVINHYVYFKINNLADVTLEDEGFLGFFLPYTKENLKSQ